MPIDPRITAAISIHSRKGVYALLLGSGVSRAADIPTGWEVVLDLINRVAELSGEPNPPDPAVWYLEKHGEEPTYSNLLAALGQTQADRSHLLKGYFEPTVEEREEGKKLPTQAHHAIAQLVADGYFKVILTTNFDRLIEQALAEAGVTSKVLASADDVDGMTPLQHSDCTVIKLHGDYLDLGSRNTPDELAEYDSRVDELLDQVLTEYGLIVCGWSAEWDEALRKAIARSTRHRFATYWLAHGSLGDQAERLVSTRSAQVIPIESADEFFEDIQQKVNSIEDGRTLHPVSREQAMATAERYLAEARHLIRLENLVNNETTRLVAALSGPSFDVDSPKPDTETIRARVERYEALTSNLASIFMVGCYWGDPQHYRLWRQSIQRIARYEFRGGSSYNAWSQMKFLPASFLLYSAGIAAIAAEKYDTLQMLFLECKSVNRGETESLIANASIGISFIGEAANELFPPKHKRETPGSDWLFERLKSSVGQFLGEEIRYTDLFNRFELLLSMSYWDLIRQDWVPTGRYGWHEYGPEGTIKLFLQEIRADGDDWPPLRVGMFSGSVERAKEALTAISKLTVQLRFP